MSISEPESDSSKLRGAAAEGCPWASLRSDEPHGLSIDTFDGAGEFESGARFWVPPRISSSSTPDPSYITALEESRPEPFEPLVEVEVAVVEVVVVEVWWWCAAATEPSLPWWPDGRVPLGGGCVELGGEMPWAALVEARGAPAAAPPTAAWRAPGGAVGAPKLAATPRTCWDEGPWAGPEAG